MSTLFSFVTVRNPRTPTELEEATGFIRPPADLDAPLLRRLVAMRQEDPQNARRQLREVRESGQVWTEVADLAEAAPALAAFATWVAQRADTVTWSQIARAAKRTGVGTGEAAEVEGRLWDNLAVLTYAGGPPELREAVIWALRAAHVLRFEGDHADDELARRAAQATPLFPAEAHTPTFLDRTPADDDVVPPEPAEPADDRAAQDRDALDRLAAAHEEVTRMVRRARDRAKGAAEPPPYTPVVDCNGTFPGAGQGPGGRPVAAPAGAGEVGAEAPPEKEHDDGGAGQAAAPERLVLDAGRLEALSPAARQGIEEVGVVEGDGLAYVLTELVDAAARRGADLAAAAPRRRVTRVGSSFWVRRPSRSDEPAPEPTTEAQVVDYRMEAQYASFWGRSAGLTKDVPRGCRVRPLGIADLRRVEQEICCFVPGEVAHIENVLKGETKERTTEHRTVVERFSSFVGEEERTTERDNQTTDRFELEKEVLKTIEFDLSLDIGVNLSAQYGPMKIVADTSFATSLATKQSDKQATEYAQEVTQKALERVVTRTREERSTRSTEEFTEKNLHTQTAVDDHVVGLYRWVNKIYKAKVVNYGKRLMFEFLVPEPAAFHLHAMDAHAGDPSSGLEMPVDPRTDETYTELGRAPIRSHVDITETNYAFWAAKYDAIVDPPPALRVTTGKAYSRGEMDHTKQFVDSKTDLTMPAGYEAYRFNAVYGLHSENHSGGPNWITMMIGRRSKHDNFGGSFTGFLDGEDDIVPVNMMGRTTFYALNVEVECDRTTTGFVTWQQRTFRAVLDGYAAKMGAYQTALAQAETQAGVQIQGSNPLFNRQTEATELQKGCLRLLTSCANLPSEAMKEDGGHGFPDFDCCEAIRDGNIVQFFEQLFEWRLMTYLFYPYFWGRKSGWTEIYRIEDVDPLFMAFLRAGFARVVVPVRPGYERAALRFLADGSLWDGGETPGVDSPMYVAIENELKQAVGEVDPTIKPWDITLPTTLTVLQCESGCVPGSGLPCPCEEEGSDDHHDGHDNGNGHHHHHDHEDEDEEDEGGHDEDEGDHGEDESGHGEGDHGEDEDDHGEDESGHGEGEGGEDDDGPVVDGGHA
jgi:hypothetical protein